MDEIISDFLISLCFEADRPAQLAGRQKVKLEDFKFAVRKDPLKLGKVEEVFERKKVRHHGGLGRSLGLGVGGWMCAWMLMIM